MYKAVKSTISGNQESWSALPAFATAYAAFSEKLAQLISLGKSQSFSTEGIYSKKRAVRRKLTIEILKLAQGLRAMTMDKGLIILRQRLNVNRTTLELKSEIKAMEIVEFVLESANEFANDLEDYGISEARIQAAEALRDEFKALMAAPRDAIVKRKEITRSINRLATELDSLLKDKLDTLVNLMEDTHRTFHGNYMDARIVVDYGGHHSGSGDDAGLTPEEPDDGEA
jgi:hypothetical protein